MAAILAPPPRTPSPIVRIRAQSFSYDSPSSIVRLNASTPIEESPFSKSTGSINVAKTVPQHHVLLPLRTKMSEESLSDSSSAMSISPASSPTKSEHDIPLDELPEGNLLGLFEYAQAPCRADALNSHPPRPVSPPCSQSPAKRPRLAPPPIALPSHTEALSDMGPISPFAFQDPSSTMTSPWLVRAVLDLHDVYRLSWMDISDVMARMYGTRTGSAEILDILSGNGRVKRMWWN
ncbi:hypothetical protein C7974DRAFT_371701 [Boeremia exigua]|uniref:uncharacterized protein n=1 Tax=Boeremia exigua TaxID=749465 RepID=UPI001E8D6A19|nr:uncharacterized protein C7974DRAFT_371701 [Boeremia exigua]KAH6644596.1 hypothetical protein C7974DRAFT_371701 [Boeremia exigua]